MSKIGRLLGSGKEAEVYEYGELALKLYRAGAAKVPAFREAANLAIVEACSLPSPRVHAVGEYDGRWGVLMDRAPGASLAGRMTRAAEASSVETMAVLHQRIHAQSGRGLPSLRSKLSANILRAGALDEASRGRMLRLLESLPAGDRLCHGDFHPWNIHATSHDVMILDWLDASIGEPAADVCRSYVLLHHVSPGLAARYVDAYSRISGLNTADIFAWLPIVAAARLAEGVMAENDSLLNLAGMARPEEEI